MLANNVYHQKTIGYDCLRCLHEAKQERLLQEPFCSYIKLLNILLSKKYCVKIREDCSRLEGRLRRACGAVKNKFITILILVVRPQIECGLKCP